MVKAVSFDIKNFIIILISNVEYKLLLLDD
jgi:hypothetical protein